MRVWFATVLFVACSSNSVLEETDSAPSPRELCIAAWQDTVLELDERQYGYPAFDGEQLWLSTYGLIDGIVVHHDVGALGCDGEPKGAPADIRYSTTQWRTRLTGNGQSALAATPYRTSSGAPHVDLRPIVGGKQIEEDRVQLPIDDREVLSIAVGPGRHGYVLAHSDAQGGVVRHVGADGMPDDILAQFPYFDQDWVRFAQDDGTDVYVGHGPGLGQTYRIDESGDVESMNPSPLRLAARLDGRRIEMYTDADGWVFANQDGLRMPYGRASRGAWPLLAVGESRMFAAVQDQTTAEVQVVAFDSDFEVVGTADAPGMLLPIDMAIIDDEHVMITGVTATVDRISVQLLTIDEG